MKSERKKEKHTPADSNCTCELNLKSSRTTRDIHLSGIREILAIAHPLVRLTRPHRSVLTILRMQTKHTKYTPHQNAHNRKSLRWVCFPGPRRNWTFVISFSYQSHNINILFFRSLHRFSSFFSFILFNFLPDSRLLSCGWRLHITERTSVNCIFMK